MSANPSHRARGFSVALSLASLLIVGCARIVPPPIAPGDDPLDQVHVLLFDSTSASSRRIENLPRSAYHAKWWFQDRLARPRSFPAEPRIDPELALQVGSLPNTTPVEVLVTFRDPVRVPVFPRARVDLPRNDPLNVALLDSAAAMIQVLEAQRSAAYQADTLFLKNNLGASGFQTFWLIQACKMVLPAGNVLTLQTAPNVVYVGPEIGPIAPDHDGYDTNDAALGRADIRSDDWLQLAMADGWIALLDTGVRTTHRLLCAPSHLCMVADLVEGTGLGVAPAACSVPTSGCSFEGGGDTYVEGHGTGTAAILTGNGVPVPPVPSNGTPNGNRFQGVTRARLDCFGVYGSDRKVRMSKVTQGIQLAMSRLDPVIVVEVQANAEPGTAGVSWAADQAYGAGFCILAANGNYKSVGVGVPAATRRTLGIGAFNLPLNTAPSDMARGPTPDGRIKPDLVAPSYLETAATKGSAPDDDMEPLGATSGATPFAAGAACLLRNWMVSGWPPPDPGAVYAMLLLSGRLDGPFAQDTEVGVGRIQLPRAGEARYVKIAVTKAMRRVDLVLPIPALPRYRRLSAAIWWPETPLTAGGFPVDTHNDIDLEIIPPGTLFGGVAASSNGVGGVFERTHVDGTPLLSGAWRIRVRAKTMRTSAQVVYVAVSLTH